MSRAATMRPMDAAAASGQLARQRCEECGVGQYPPGEVCRVCLSDRLTWTVAASAPGELMAITTVQHSFEPATQLPQRVGLVQLEVGMVAVCFVDPQAQPGVVTIRARLDAAGRAVLVAGPC